MNSISGNRLDGQWSDPVGKRFAPIHLERIKATTKGRGYCSDEAISAVFNASRVNAQTIAAGEIKEFEGRQFREISTLDGNIQSIQLIGEPAMVSVFNEILRDGLKEQISAYFECQTDLDRLSGSVRKQDSGYFLSTKVVALNGQWITLRTSGGGTCGGAHDTNGTSVHTHNVSNGKRVELARWLRGSKKGDSYYIPPEKLSADIIRQAIRQSKANHPPNGNQECLALLSSFDERYTLSLGKMGMVFSTYFPHQARACDEEIEIPYAKLLPFLTSEGTRAVNVLLGAIPTSDAKTNHSSSPAPAK